MPANSSSSKLSKNWGKGQQLSSLCFTQGSLHWTKKKKKRNPGVRSLGYWAAPQSGQDSQEKSKLYTHSHSLSQNGKDSMQVKLFLSLNANIL